MGPEDLQVQMWCLHKYDPKDFREGMGYLGHDWDDVSDVGRQTLRKTLTWDEYLETEDAYISCIKYFIDLSGEDVFEIRKFVDMPISPEDQRMWGWGVENVSHDYLNGERVSNDLMYDFCRLSLRNLQAFVLTNRKNMFFAFLEYMYVHIGVSEDIRFDPGLIVAEGLFLEDVTEIYVIDDSYHDFI